jgi:hypothetical protein
MAKRPEREENNSSPFRLEIKMNGVMTSFIDMSLKLSEGSLQFKLFYILWQEPTLVVRIMRLQKICKYTLPAKCWKINVRQLSLIVTNMFNWLMCRNIFLCICQNRHEEETSR